MPFLSSIGLSITARCPVACAHCIIEAGPFRQDEMSPTDAEMWIRQAAAYRDGFIRSIVITGGEPFFNRNLLENVLRYAESNGLIPVVVTNAFWADTRSGAMETLRRLPQIRMLAISTDLYHRRSIPLAYIKNAVSAAEEMGLKYNIAICFVDEREPRYLEFITQLEQIVDPCFIKAYPVYPAGRAKKTINPQCFVTSDEYPAGPCTGADFPTIFPDGRVIGCMGMLMDLPEMHPLLYGNLREKSLQQILDQAEMNVALHIMRIWGPGRLLEMLRARGLHGKISGPFMKNGHCILCYALRLDDQLRDGVQALAQDPEMINRVAYARVYYLNETTMARQITPVDDDPADS